MLLAACEGSIMPGGFTGTGGGSTSLPPTAVDPSPKTMADCGASYSPGHAMIHRLDNNEYNNTVRDLLFTSSTPANGFASSSVGSSGFTNESDVLTLSDQIVADYVTAAQALADEALASKGSAQGAWAKLAGCAASTASPDMTCVKSVVQAFAEHAFRRPIDSDDLTELMTVYGGETTFADGFHDVIVAVLLDPRFLFNYINHTSPDDPAVVVALDSYELASRLSYFLWQSMPDDVLLSLAKNGQLTDATVLGQQVKRMLMDPRAMQFATQWRKDWAHLTLLDGTAGYGGLPVATTNDLRQQVDLMIQDMVTTDASLLTLVSTDHTFVNKAVADFYGWSIPAATSSTFVKTQAPDTQRRGVLTQAALMLTIGGGESYTHPVQRGRWVMDSLLCAPPPPPPAGVPALDSSGTSDETIRVRLSAHVSNPGCSGCHATMDVYGFGLENYDMQGKWRTTYVDVHNAPIDATGTLPDGRSFTTPQEMIDLLAADPAVQGCLTQKVMAYALARPIAGTDDRCIASTLGTQFATPTSTLSDLFTHVALSHQFLMQAGATP